jgi:hypothetical protein
LCNGSTGIYILAYTLKGSKEVGKHNGRYNLFYL